nr:hypothetical protein [Mesorhizobium waimense]
MALREMIPPRLAHTVTFTGMEPYEKVIERCAGASLLVNPSLSESFGMRAWWRHLRPGRLSSPRV